MKIHRFDAHDRLQHLKKDQSANIAQGAEDCLKRNKLSLALQEKSPYIYIFAHARTHDDGVTKVMYWQPRLSRPKAEINSFLFRCKSHEDLFEVCWLIPPEEFWEQYKRGNVTQHEIVLWSIRMFKENKELLEKPDPEDLPEQQAAIIYKQVIQEHKEDLKRSIIKPNFLAES